MNKIKMTGIIMLLSLGVSGSVMAGDASSELSLGGGSKNVNEAMTAAMDGRSVFLKAGGLCALAANKGGFMGLFQTPVNPNTKGYVFYEAEGSIIDAACKEQAAQ